MFQIGNLRNVEFEQVAYLLNIRLDRYFFYSLILKLWTFWKKKHVFPLRENGEVLLEVFRVAIFPVGLVA